MTWFKVIHCVETELFPALSIKLRECIEEKLSAEPHFKIDDLGSDAVNDVIERLKAKRTTNFKELTYLRALIQRAQDHAPSQQSLVIKFKLLKFERS